MSEEETIMSGEEIITEFIQNATGFRFVTSDLTTGKVVVNNIEITSIEDWNKVTHSIVELQQENSQLKEELKREKETRKKAIEYIETHKRKDEFLELNEWETRELLEILKGE